MATILQNKMFHAIYKRLKKEFDWFDQCYEEPIYFDSSHNLQIEYELWEYYHRDSYKGFQTFYLTFTITDQQKLILNRIEIHESMRGEGIAKRILEIFDEVSFLFTNNTFHVKYPDNKPFWKYYKEKYNNDIKFIYK